MREFRYVSGHRSLLGTVAIGVYAWVYAISLGLVVLDGIYARELRAGVDSAATERIFSEISDFLLFPTALVVLSGALALVVGWQSRAVRNLVLVSLLLPLASLPLAALFGAEIDATGLGPAVRTLLSLSGSLLAMLGTILFAGRSPGSRGRAAVA